MSTPTAQFPLLDSDPVKVGDFWLDARLTATAAGTAFTAHQDDSDQVMLILLSEGAAEDPAARSRFSGEVNAMHIDTVVARGGEGQHEGRMAVRFRHEDDDPEIAGAAALAPWVAMAFDGSPHAVEEAQRVLNAVDLATSPPLGEVSGPDYRLHWIDKAAHGRTRLWPLPWPGRGDRAGWVSILVSFLLMVLLTALAILLAILLFQNQPPVNAPQPIPSPASGASDGGSPSGSPSTPSNPSNTPSYSHTPSMNQPSGTQSGPGTPSPNRRL